MESITDKWNSGDPYEYFMGRWSRLMAPVFLQWLNFPDHKNWLDLGCGTGALSEAIDKMCKPKRLSCVDPSAAFLSKAKERNLQNATFYVGTASEIPISDHSVDIVASGLALNFFPDLAAGFSEMKRVLLPGGAIAAYVWDYAGRMEFLRMFWDTARELDREANQLDEGNRFPICNAERLQQAFSTAGLIDIQCDYLDIDTVFKNFDDYWDPFLGGQGPAPTYLSSLSAYRRDQLKTNLQRKLPVAADGSIKLVARAIAIQGSGI
jgi:SAM-dependent methyltransferase